MAEEIVAPATATEKKAKKKTAKPKKPATHPKYSEMIKKAVTDLKERGGSSRQAILKYIMANFKVGNDAKTVNSHLKMSLRAGVKNGGLKQSKGTGASGSFRLGEKAAAKKPAVKKPKKPATKKPKKPAAKKPKAKKPAAKKAKSPKKAAAKKSPKKASKPKTKKPKSPKKASKPKKKTTKKAASKKK